jgi:hypothetical protein
MKDSIQAGYKLVQDANLANASGWLGCQTSSAPAELQRALALSTHTHPKLLLARQQSVKLLRLQQPQWDSRFQRIHELEEELLPTFTATSKEKENLEDETLAQLSFQGDWTRHLNHIPFFLTLLAIFKIWAVPALVIATPLLAWILPYLLLKFVYMLPISQEQYLNLMRGMWSGALGGGLELGPDGRPQFPSMWTPKSLAQGAFFVFSFVQSLIQPIQNAIHLYNTDIIFTRVGQRLLELEGLVEEFRRDLHALELPPFKLSMSLSDLRTGDARQAFHLIKEQPDRLRIALRDLSRLEILYRIAQAPQFKPAVFRRTQFQLTDVIDLSIQDHPAVPSSLLLSQGQDQQSHAVVTGPNGGGKSSFLRSILQATLFSHAYGFAAAAQCILPRFVWIASGLQLRDSPGILSMFETEVQFAARVLQMANSTGEPGLVLFDELFHSTNPPDSARTAQVFLHPLWQLKSAFSVVSTHVFPLVEKAPKGVVQAICCAAKETPEGEILFSFQVEPGICRVSSVKKVWERFGLGPAPAAANPPPAKPSTEGELEQK